MSDPEQPRSQKPSKRSQATAWATEVWRRLERTNSPLETIKNVIPTVSLLLVVVSLLITQCQNGAVNRHNQATDRPWILALPVVNVVKAGKNMASFSLRFTMKNVGHTPAFAAWVLWEPIGVLSGDPENDRRISNVQQSACDGGRQENNYSSSIIYPGAEIIAEHDEWAPVVDVDEVISKGRNRMEESARALFHDDKNVKIMIDWEVRYWLVGCINYRFDAVGSVHQSSFAYQVEVPTNYGPDEMLRSHQLSSFDRGTYHEGGLTFRATSIGAFAN